MKHKPIILREIASADIDQHIAYYQTESTLEVTQGFIDVLEQGFTHIESHPESGSGSYARELNLAGLMSWPLKRYPYIIFYMNRDNHIDVWRVLHSHRDLPHWLRNPD